MSNIIIKQATIENLPDVQNLNNQLFTYEYQNWDQDLKLGWPLEEAGTKYFTQMITNQFVALAFDGEKAIGYLAGNTNAANAYLKIKVAEIDNMFIEENYRDAQIGTMLIDKFKEYCLKKGINTFKVNASWPNKKAIAFYKKNGFAEHDLTLWCQLDDKAS